MVCRSLTSISQELPEDCKDSGIQNVSQGQKWGVPGVGEMWAECSHGASLELSWTYPCPHQLEFRSLHMCSDFSQQHLQVVAQFLT